MIQASGGNGGAKRKVEVMQTRYSEFDALPSFANEENRKLDAEVREKEKKLAAVVSVLDDNALRAEALRVHLRNITGQTQHLQHLQEARVRELKTEAHLHDVAERETGRLSSDIKDYVKQHSCCIEQTSTTQTNIYKISENIATLRDSIKCEAEELNEWLKVQQEKEEDHAMIVKYSKEDDKRIHELTCSLERNLASVQKLRSELSRHMTESRIAQLEVERAGEEFRKLHNERQGLLKQWEHSVQVIKQRDEAVVKATEEFAKIKDTIARAKMVAYDRQRALDSANHLRAASQRENMNLEKHVSRLRMDYNDAKEKLSENKDEVDALKKDLMRSESEVKDKELQTKMINEKTKTIKAKTERLEQLALQVQCKIDAVAKETTTSEEKATLMQGYLRQDEQRGKELEREIRKAKETVFKHNQELQKQQNLEKTLNGAIAGSNAAIRALNTRISKLDQELVSQRTIIYHQNFMLQQGERKLRQLQGEHTDDERLELIRRSEELASKLKIANEVYKMLQSQLKRAHDDVRNVRQRVYTLELERNEVTKQIDSAVLYCASAASQLSSKIREKEELMVEESILLLEVRKMRGLVANRAGCVHSLESRRVQLQHALEERVNEIDTHKTMLRMQQRSVDEDRIKFIQELRERQDCVARLKMRYEITMGEISAVGASAEQTSHRVLGKRASSVTPIATEPKARSPNKKKENKTTGGETAKPASPSTTLEDGEIHSLGEKSQAYYIIRAAQQREAMMREGASLEAQINKAEREIKALQVMRGELDLRNENFKHRIENVGVDEDTIEHLASLEKQVQAATAQLNLRRAAVAKLQQELMTQSEKIMSLATREQFEQSAIADEEAQVEAATKEVACAQSLRLRAWLLNATPAQRRAIAAASGAPGGVLAGITVSRAGTVNGVNAAAAAEVAGRIKPVPGDTEDVVDIRLREAREAVGVLLQRLEHVVSRVDAATATGLEINGAADEQKSLHAMVRKALENQGIGGYALELAVAQREAISALGARKEPHSHRHRTDRPSSGFSTSSSTGSKSVTGRPSTAGSSDSRASTPSVATARVKENTTAWVTGDSPTARTPTQVTAGLSSKAAPILLPSLRPSTLKRRPGPLTPIDHSESSKKTDKWGFYAGPAARSLQQQQQQHQQHQQRGGGGAAR